MPTKSVNVAKTKDYTAEFTDTAGTSTWLSGWNALTGVRLTHIGKGTLSMSSNGKTGSISTTMVRYTGSLRGTVHVTATWNC